MCLTLNIKKVNSVDMLIVELLKKKVLTFEISLMLNEKKIIFYPGSVDVYFKLNQLNIC